MPCGHDRRPAEQRLCCCGERRPCVRRGAWERGRAAGSGEWRRAPGLQVARKCAALCLLQLQCERRRDNDRGAPVRHAREPVLGEGGDWHPLGTAYSFNTRLSTWFSRHRGPKGVWPGTSTKGGSKQRQPSTQRASTIRVLKRTSLLKLVEWSYPRNWGSFVWNEEGRSEYILSLPISSPGWLHSYHTLLLQLVHPNVRNPWLFHEGCYGKLQHRLRATAVHQVGHTHSSSTKNHGPTVPCC